MIARILVPLLLVILLPDAYIDRHFLRRKHYPLWERLLWLLPSLGMVAFTILLSMEDSFVPEDVYWVRLYIALLGLYVLPRLFFVGCSVVGLVVRKLFRLRYNWGNLFGLLVAGFCLYTFVYGYTIGFRRIEVKHVDLYFDDLPKRFDGFRIVHFTDAHVGTYDGRRRALLQRAVDSIQAQHPDIICFTGDLQNVQPSEIYPVAGILSQLKAKHGVYSVLGNHDYSLYIDDDPAICVANERETIARERQMGWRLLLNEHAAIRIGADSIVVAGMENDGQPPFPEKSDIGKTLHGVPSGAFTLMLQHDPSSWQRTILPRSHAQLTLSGHTHGGQFGLFGWRPTRWRYKQDLGLYEQQGRYLYVSGGLGGVVPYRYGVYSEVTLITLHSKQ